MTTTESEETSSTRRSRYGGPVSLSLQNDVIGRDLGL